MFLTQKRSKATLRFDEPIKGKPLLRSMAKLMNLIKQWLSSAMQQASSPSPASWAAQLPGCDDETTDVLLETALWNPQNIAQTGRKLGISSDARYRFERGVDPAFAIPGAELATQLILKYCGGEASHLTLLGSNPPANRVINFPWRETSRLTGVDTPIKHATTLLEGLGFQVRDNGMQAELQFPAGGPMLRARQISLKKYSASQAWIMCLQRRYRALRPLRPQRLRSFKNALAFQGAL